MAGKLKRNPTAISSDEPQLSRRLCAAIRGQAYYDGSTRDQYEPIARLGRAR